MLTQKTTFTRNIFNIEKLAGYTLAAFTEARRDLCFNNSDMYLDLFTQECKMQFANDYSELYIQVYFKGYKKVCAKLAITTKDNSVYLFEELDKAECDKHRDTINYVIDTLQKSINHFRRENPFHTTNYVISDTRYIEFYESVK